MKVWELSKKILGIGLVCLPLTMSTSLTGCLTDDDKETAKVDSPTVDNSKALTVEKKDTVWNVKGPNKGAFNLVAGTQVSESEANANKDLVDLAVLSGGTVTWPKTLGSLNNTTFVTAPSGFNYDSATDSTLIKAFAAGTATPTTKVLADNDVILAKLRAGNSYAVIKIYKVVEVSDNKDYFYFGYRLTP